MPLAREGYPFIGASAFVTLVMALLGYDFITGLTLLLTLFIIYFFRDPERTPPDEEDVLVSPADGRIILIEKVFDERFVKEHVYKVSIFMNIFNVHVNRVPFPGRVLRVQHKAGRFYAADTERAGLENETCAIIMETKSEQRLAVVQMAGYVARRIVCQVEKDDVLKRGQRFGMIRFGSRVDLYLPLQVQLEVTTGMKVRAGETTLGYLS